MDMPPTFVHENIEKPLLGRPNCPYPKSGQLKPNASKKYDGWITLENLTDHSLKIKMCFTLPHGYHLEILGEDDTLIFSKQLTIHGSYQIIETDDGLDCLSITD